MEVAALGRHASQLRTTVRFLEQRAASLRETVASLEARVNDSNGTVAQLTTNGIVSLKVLQDIDIAFAALAPLCESSDELRAVFKELHSRMENEQKNSASKEPGAWPGAFQDWRRKGGGPGGSASGGAGSNAV